MRKELWSILTVSLLLASAAGVRGDDEARAVIEKAVNAQGGLDKLTQPRAAHRQSRGIYHMEKYGFTSESWSQAPGKIKIIHQSTDKNDPGSRLLVLNSDKGWMVMEGVTVDLGPDQMARFSRARHGDRVASLVVLLKDKSYKLTSLADRQDKGKDLAGVRVAHEGQPDIDLFFDKETGLLFKTSQRYKDSGDTEDVTHEWYYTDYKVLDLIGPDERLLQAAKLSTDGASLLRFLRRRTPPAQVREQILDLVRKLSDPAFRVRSKATADLKKFAPEAGSLLRPALEDPDREVVRRAQECLDLIALNPETALVPAALRLIALRKPADAVPVLLNYLPWAPDEKIADDLRAALTAVAVRDGKPDLALTQALESNDPLLREAAAIALGRGPKDRKEQPGRRVLIDGLRISTKCEHYRDGRRDVEFELLHVEYFNRLEDSLFAHP